MKTVTPSPSKSVKSISESLPSISLSNTKTPTSGFASPSFSSQYKSETLGSNLATGGLYIVKILFIGIILSLLGYNLYLYLVEGTDILSKYFGITLWPYKKDVREEDTHEVSNVSNAVKKTKDIITNAGDRIKDREKTDVQVALENNTQDNSNREKDNVEQDNTDSNMVFKGNNKGAYCYIGSENGTRSCVKIESGDSCQSKQIFPTLNMCINPNLRN